MNKAEELRINGVKRLLNLKVSRESELQGIVEMAAEICQVPVAAVNFTQGAVQFIRSEKKGHAALLKQANGHCNKIIKTGQPFVTADIDSGEPTLSKAKAQLQFFAGTPITTFDGVTIGALYVVDVCAKALTDKQLNMLALLSRQVITIVEFDLSIDVLKAQYYQVKNSENKLRSFFDSSVSCHFLLDPDMRIIAFNKTAAKFVKAALNVKLKPGILMTDHVENVGRFSRNFYKALSGKVVKTEIEVNYKDGPIWWGTMCEPAYDSDGQIIGVSYNATDITEAKRNEQKISSQNDILRKIASVQSHELRRPVASILGLMNLIRLNNYVADKELFDMLEHATAELDEQIHSIIRQVEIN